MCFYNSRLETDIIFYTSYYVGYRTATASQDELAISKILAPASFKRGGWKMTK